MLLLSSRPRSLTIFLIRKEKGLPGASAESKILDNEVQIILMIIKGISSVKGIICVHDTVRHWTL